MVRVLSALLVLIRFNLSEMQTPIDEIELTKTWPAPDPKLKKTFKYVGLSSTRGFVSKNMYEAKFPSCFIWAAPWIQRVGSAGNTVDRQYQVTMRILLEHVTTEQALEDIYIREEILVDLLEQNKQLYGATSVLLYDVASMPVVIEGDQTKRFSFRAVGTDLTVKYERRRIPATSEAGEYTPAIKQADNNGNQWVKNH